MTDLTALFSELSREPDLDAPELQAYDATDELLIETAAEHLAGIRPGTFAVDGATTNGRAATSDPAASEEPGAAGPGPLVTIGDRHGALTLGAARVLGARDIRVFQDPLLAERALIQNAARLGLSGAFHHHPLGESLLADARLVLLQLPRSLAELKEIAWAVASYAHLEVVLLAGGRDKHLSRGMNEVLGKYFGEVHAGLGKRKSRVLTARMPKPEATFGDAPFPTWGRDPDLPFALAAYGATFAGATLDHGSRLLLGTLGTFATLGDLGGDGKDARGRATAPAHKTAPGHSGEWIGAGTDPRTPGPQHIVDLGCGNGVLAVAAALLVPEARVIASDQSLAAASSTWQTVTAAGVADRVEVHRADATEAVPDGWADLMLLNPPFHSGATVHTEVAHRLIRAAARALARGGELRLVFNSHLGYRSLVERVIGPTRQLARDRTFTVLSAIRR